MSAQGYTSTILTPSGSYLVGNTGLLATLKLKVVDPETGSPTGTVYPATAHIGNGQYAFGDIPYNCYKMYNGDTEITGFHGTSGKGKWVGASSFDAAIITSGEFSVDRIPDEIPATKIADGTVSSAEFQYLNGVTSAIQTQLDGKGNLSGANPTGQWTFSGAYPLVDDAIESPTDPRHVTTKDYVDGLDSLVVHKTGSETISGPKQFAGNVVINTSTGLLTQSAYAAPSDDKNYAPKKYVDDQVASIRAIPYQEGSNTVRVISDGTTEAGKVYRAIAAASSYFGTTTSTNPVFINLVKHATGGVFYINGSSTIKNYMTISGQGHKTWVVLSDGNTSLTKDAEFRNLSLFLGANDITSARTYNSLTFRDCIIYAYENTTFNNCKFYNTIIIHAATKSASLAGCIAWNSHFNQYTASDTLTLGVYTHGFDTGLSYYTLPTDPSLEP